MPVWHIILLFFIIFLLGGFLIPRIPYFGSRFLSSQITPEMRTTEITRWKLVSVLLFFTLLLIVGFWGNYYYTYLSKNFFLSKVFEALFGVSAAALIGGVVFELMLRKDLLSDAQHELANIVMVEEKSIKNFFDPKKRNEIIKKFCIVQLDDKTFGEALYSSMQAYLEGSWYERGFRLDFTNYITFSKIEKSDLGLNEEQSKQIIDNYYKVREDITFMTRAELYRENEEFVIGIARTEEGLYQLFLDKRSPYRWFFPVKEENIFEDLVKNDKLFDAKLSINDTPCEVVNNRGHITKRGFEIIFKNPLFKKQDLLGNMAKFKIEPSVLHPKSDNFLSIHLVYPVRNVRIQVFYSDTDIKRIKEVYFLTPRELDPGRWRPKILDLEKSKIFELPQGWVFPDSGVVFIWY